MRGGGFETAEAAMRNSEWAAVIGECWKIPYDNRINFCFRAGMSGPKSVLRVQKFLSHFHKPIPNALRDNFSIYVTGSVGVSQPIDTLASKRRPYLCSFQTG
jgi:hypothetical protein